jgi:class 3 adenylate cyclase
MLLGDLYEIKIARNGITALKIAQSEPAPDIILLDILLPDVTGYEIAKELLAKESTRKVPIIFVTGKVDEDSIAKAFQLGAVDYVKKPFNPTELLARMSTHLNLKIAREQLERMANQLGKYLSPSVYDSIFAGDKNVKIESYRKVLTVCFTDIIGFTTIAESMDHQELTHWLNIYLDRMAKIALEHGGTLDKFIGDAVMVFFGDPNFSSVEIDATNCIKMAQAMIQEAQIMGINIRVGINTGMCTIGNFGSEDRMDYTIIGKEVNLAQRLESKSLSSSILISESTYELIKDAFDCRPAGLMEMKGIDREIATYTITNSDQGTPD